MRDAHRFVYVLRSVSDPSAHYVGLTADVSRRLAEHNRGASFHTSHGGPWELLVSIEFANGESAATFEQYLKTGSRRAFAKRHFV
jgi:predicted GIY-YIG superfamily endonuclease